MSSKSQLIPFVVETDEGPEVTHYTAQQIFGGGAWRPNTALPASKSLDNVIVMQKGVPTDGKAFAAWLRKWHAKNNATPARYVAKRSKAA